MYYILETFLKQGTIKMELFGRIYNQRDNWITAGNESINLKRSPPKDKKLRFKCEPLTDLKWFKEEN